ncbi:hypothetical protein KGQ19_26845 [Catenulispora sp. NL8]|uniref:Uncharacterized protein n=1 Tax=Catenulispora pinistramenti TaxID=2705254 RepID=A0ABS5KWT9_9ACTN|nr:hypothetical protein [Catenulispora pinistramenti]MBS2550494.1 hypothetical protein [Catenulispora pinistramenti]
MADVHGLRATLAYIQDNPQRWRQDSWQRCFAAIAVELAGYDVLPSRWVRLDSRSVQVWDAAVEVLDLTGDQGWLLFNPGNTLAELRMLIAEITRPRHAPRHSHGLRLVR